MDRRVTYGATLAIGLILFLVAETNPLVDSLMSGNFSGPMATGLNLAMIASIFIFWIWAGRGLSSRLEALFLLPFGGVFLALVWFFGWMWQIDLKQVFLISSVHLLLSFVVCVSYGTILYSIVSLVFRSASSDNEA